MTEAKKNEAVLKPGFRLLIQGLISDVHMWRGEDGTQKPIFSTTFRVPSEDKFEDTLKLTIKSSHKLGEVGEEASAYVGISSRFWKNANGQRVFDPQFWAA
jgi:hypothetical protein